jgi:hypothetical protein
VDQHLVRADRVAQALAQAVDRTLQGRVLERLYPAARIADDMVVVLPARQDRLVARSALADVDPLEEAGAVKDVDRAVDAREADRALAGAQTLRDLMRGQAAALPRQQLNNLAAGAAGAVALLLEGGAGGFLPGVVLGGGDQ